VRESSAAPYISVVIVSRNDDHGSKMFQRTRLCVDSLLCQLERYAIPSEFILVEWIPPPNKPLLKDVYPWPKKTEHVEIRVVVVPSSAVGSYTYSEEFAIRDLTPWNVAIRRANGTFVLSTVADSLFSDELIAYIAGRNLDKDKLYRIDRCDVNRSLLEGESFDRRLEYCENNIIDMHKLNPLKFLLKPKLPVMHNKAPGDFILMSREKWHHIHGFPQGVTPGGDNMVLFMAHLSGAKQEVLRKPMRLYHIDHDSGWKSPAYVFLRRVLIKARLPFFMVDILSNLGNRLIPAKSEWEKRNACILSSRLANTYVDEMVSGKRPYIFNDDAWGLRDQAVDEFVITP